VSNYFFIRTNGRFLRIRIEDIQFIRAAGSYVTLVTNKDNYLLAQNLSQFARRNPEVPMLRIHRSFLVNARLIDSFDDKHIYVGSHSLPLGASYREKFMRRVVAFQERKE
jgi:two-component system LytT family response regulator